MQTNSRSECFRQRAAILLAATMTSLAATSVLAGDDEGTTVDRHSKLPFRTLFVTRSLGHERLMPYLETARPEIVQIGNYGAMFHGYADNPRSAKTPMMLPVVGERAALEFQRKLNAEVHKLGLKVVGHFRLAKVMADWQEQTGFVEYYNKRWPTDLLGPKPHPQLIELLQRDGSGAPVQLSRYDNAQLALCLSSPHARQMLKQMLKCAIDHGIDGVITTYNYRSECACNHCQSAFKEWLATQRTPEQLRTTLGINNLEQHKFTALPARIPGYPDAEKSNDLDWLAATWGAEHFKRMFDEIFLDYGRSLRKDLLVSQWNHLSHVSISEERMFLPQPKWGRGEDYFWYSGGAAFVGKNLSLTDGKAGDAWLSCLYVRELAGRKPFVMGKYDRIRLAASMAEGFATGGLGMGRYMRFEDPVGFEVLARYTNFMHTHREFFDGTEPFADAALVLPRQSVWNRRPDALNEFRSLGQSLVESRVLLDVVADEALTPERLANYPAVILPNVVALSDKQLMAVREYSAKGGLVLVRGETAVMDEYGVRRQDSAIKAAVTIADDPPKVAAAAIVKRLQSTGASEIEAPWTVRGAAYTQPGRVVLHLVNYDRDETPNKQLTGPELERPKAVDNVSVRLRLPVGKTATTVTLLSPDGVLLRKLEHRHQDGRVLFTVPRVVVYAVVAISLD
ncbi:MAG: hypothetical protein O3A00_12500 [Planctomycetota bacterium]|nr:hypothetical protein [Planctomycetota bacterium]